MTTPTPPPFADLPPFGTRVIAVAGNRRLTGVLLPPKNPDGPLRLHSDNGRLFRLQPGKHVVAPEQGLAERRADRRRTECPAGRPLYRHGELPATQLATVTMLRRARRRLADEQMPIASYPVQKGYAPLYAVADTVPLPALSPKRQAARDIARTCTRCGARRGDADEPFTRWHRDGQRYCEPCQEPAAEEWWTDQRAEGRRVAAAWAAGVLADPNVVLIHAHGSADSMTLRAETLDGQVLVEGHLFNRRVPGWWSPESKAGVIRPADIVDPMRDLAGRRLITWYRGPVQRGELSRAMAEAAAPETFTFTVAATDEFGPHWDEWIAERNTRSLFHGAYNMLRSQPEPVTEDWTDRPAAVVAHMRQALTTMAAPASAPGPEGEGDRT